jgi:hypothetical protein
MNQTLPLQYRAFQLPKIYMLIDTMSIMGHAEH